MQELERRRTDRTARVGLALGLALALAGCGGSEAGSGESGGTGGATAGTAAREASPRPEPEVDPEARYDGRTLAEYAVGLDDLSAGVRRRAIEDLVNFGANAYPLRDRFREMAREDPDEELRGAALMMLFEIEDPGATEFLLERLREPGAMESDHGWRGLLEIASRNVDEGRLVEHARGLAGDAPAHAEHLMRLLLDGGQGSRAAGLAIADVVVSREHDDASVASLVRAIGELDLGDEQRVEYVRANASRLPDVAVAVAALRALGTPPAFDATLEVLEAAGYERARRASAIEGFPPGGATDARKLEELAGLLPAPTEPELQQVLGTMDRIVASSEDAGAAPRFQALLTGFAEDAAASEDLRALALLYLCDGVAKGRMGAEALDPAFDVLANDDVEVVLGTALQQLQPVVRQASEEVRATLPARIADTMYAREPEDPWRHAVAQGLLDCARAGVAPASLDTAALLDAWRGHVEAHPAHPVNVQLLRWLVPLANTLGQAGAPMPEVARLVGGLMVGEAMTEADRDWIYNTNLSSFNNVTRADAATMMAFYEPMMLVEELPDHPYFARVAQTMAMQISYLEGYPGRDEYVDFVWRMTREAAPARRIEALDGLNFWLFQAHTGQRTGMAHIELELAGRPARVKPIALRAMNATRVLEPRHFTTGEPGEAFLMNRLDDAVDASFGSLRGIDEPRAVAFLDDAGEVIALGRTDDEALRLGQGNNARLTHPSARHALMYALGEFELEVGDVTGLDPALLALL